MGDLKAIFWTETSVHRYAFNFDEELSGKIKKKKLDVALKLKTEDNEDDLEIKQIFDYGVRRGIPANYNEDIPEALLVLDEDDIVHIMKPEVFGNRFVNFLKYDNDQFDEEFEHCKIQKVHDMILIDNYKIAGIIEKKE